ncbi:MAG: WD40/YVTN/BNR-like repeat-containing protein, partial [Ignavibacteria bacterium]
MKKLFVILIMFTAMSVNAQWTTYQTNTTMDLYKIQFVNSNTGFAAGGGTVYSDSAVFFKTTNGGTNWIKYIVYDSTSTPIDEVYGLSFLNSNTGYVCGRSWNVFKTTNGGQNWLAVRLPYFSLTQIYNALYFINENTGYAAGRYGYFCKTTNGGINWSLVKMLSANLFCLKFFNEMTGYVGD